MSSRRDAAQILAMVAWVRRQLNKIQDRANAEVDVRFGGEALHAHITSDGKDTVVSNTVRVQPAPKLAVEDEARFTEWVKGRWPTEITEAVNPRFLEELKTRMKDTGVLVDDDGVVCPWVELVDPDPYTRTSLKPAADEVLAPLLEQRTLIDLLRFIEDEPIELDREAS